VARDDAMTLGRLADAIEARIEDLGRSAPVRVIDENERPIDATGRVVAVRTAFDREFCLTVRR
jgi:hypothetical protein